MTTDSTDREKFRLHPLQLGSLLVMELHAKMKPGHDIETPIEPSNFLLSSGRAKYDESEHSIAVKIAATIGYDDENVPFEMRVELVGVFVVDEKRFPLVHLDHWAETNAPLVLYPYLREHVYSLTGRLGVMPVLLPLFEIPTFRITDN